MGSMRAQVPSLKRQRGATLVLLALATTAFAAMVAIWYSIKAHEQADVNANAQAQALSQFATGMRGFIADVQGGSITLSANPYSVAGVDFLRPPSCGGLSTNPAQGYVPCSFVATPYLRAYRTTVTYTPATNTVESLTSYFVEPGGNAANAGGMAAKVAYAANAQGQPSNGMFMTVLANAPSGANTQPAVNAIAPADRGRVTLVLNNSPSNDIWLRTDGTNQMLADLNLGGHSIDNAKDASLTGDLRVDGVAQVNGGLTVTNGTADLRGGAMTPDVAVTSVGHMASQAIYDAQVLTGSTSYNVPKPNCSSANLGNSTPSIYAALQGTGSPGGNGDALYEAHVQVTDNGTSWHVTPVVQATTFTLSGKSQGDNLILDLNKSLTRLNAADQTVLVMIKCR